MILEQYPSLVAALCLWREARGCTREEKVAVLWVILNRVKDTAHFPLHNRKRPIPEGYRLASIVLDPWQFSSFNSNDPNAVKMPVPGDAEWEDFSECCEVLDSPGVFDPTAGAQYYHSYEDRNDKRWPKWAVDSKQTLVTKRFRFYKL